MKYPVGTHITRPWRGKTLHARVVKYDEKEKRYTIMFQETKTEHLWHRSSLDKTFTIVRQLPEELFHV